ncbi:tol-pal system protein YbgF [Meinhardsimonia xiamenensis]|jgi:tol-pal system protein YbgF|uniref:Cell division coordinator CpoB n=1 Tax=Meinhardsimonia xiamenensis TaxID=990712 RepID=A0A1G9B2Z9_9RHOB|nr:tol-pal system protein YbgF [Meinhardsimonia xiamenensis]PRX35160.1 tol-pal system protein YbgF [Meinhardsimonia xiamenensis]SDK33360.1 tol-pal system protein YbgF [Meinhardsimonia xiamenensis]
MRQGALAAGLALALLGAAPAHLTAQETLADLRQELQVLKVELMRLNRELVTTGGPSAGLAGSSLPERVALIERELRRLTAKTEELQHRIERIVADGTNRIGDIEFRLCELDPKCDISTLGQTRPLGGAQIAPAPVSPPAAPPPSGASELAVGERADFDRALAAHEAGEHARAAELFAAFLETYPGSPLATEALLWRGQALEAEGRSAEAARAYLEAFSSAPEGPEADEALYRLGLMLDELGQREEACVTLGEVVRRFPDTEAAGEAEAARARMACQ